MTATSASHTPHSLDRNTVVEAGAGTGKTTWLIDTLLRALLLKGVPLSSIVALTFTKKAAGEMKERLAKELQSLARSPLLPARYSSWNRSLAELQPLAQTALEEIDRAHIGTIHSFAFSLLKRFSLSAGIDPGAEVDENELKFDQLFESLWPRWLSVELAEDSPHAASWLELFQILSLSDLEETARNLCDFKIPLDSLPVSDKGLGPRLAPFHKRIRELLSLHGPIHNTGKAAAACEEILGLAVRESWDRLKDIPAEVRESLDLESSETKTWSDEETQLIKWTQALCRNLLKRGDHHVALLTELLKPFVSDLRDQALAGGILSHSALLYLARELLRTQKDIRRLLKQEFRMILIDEFQDTDPLQAEMILFLAEEISGNAERWTEVHLEQGKLFVVGDPKQSIYRFRGADIAAYRQMADLIEEQGGVQETLKDNFRSQAEIVDVVNAAFEVLIQKKGLISPAYTPLNSTRERSNPEMQKVELRLVRSSETLRSEESFAAEAGDIAEWIASQVQELSYQDKDGIQRKLEFRDVALIFRTNSPVRFFVESLRRRGIPFVVEGERYFFTTPEVTDLINFLEVIEDPSDSLSLAGLLRSPLGGLTDSEIAALAEAQSLDFSRPSPASLHTPPLENLRSLVLALHKRVGRDPLPALLDAVFADTFLLELGARSYHGDQTLANLFKLKRLLETFSRDAPMTLKTLLSRVSSFMEDDTLEGESPLADENYNAVRILTIHKAKGLEFPVVFLPGLHAGRRQGAFSPWSYDWRSGMLGLTVGAEIRNLNKFILDEETRNREKEEENRILYVAMTRARERLVLSSGILKRSASEAFIQKLQAGWGMDAAILAEGIQTVKGRPIHVSWVEPRQVSRENTLPAADVSRYRALDPQDFAKTWRDRRESFEALIATPRLVHPSSPLVRSLREASDPWAESEDIVLEEEKQLPSFGPMLGTLLHRFLEQWNFSLTADDVRSRLEPIISRFLSHLVLRPASFNEQQFRDEALSIAAVFIRSKPHLEIQSSHILGREIPFLYESTQGVLTMVRGRMDVLYRNSEGKLIVADYKTDRLGEKVNLAEESEKYRAQADVYRQAVARAMGEAPQFKIIYLRRGVSVEVL